MNGCFWTRSDRGTADPPVRTFYTQGRNTDLKLRVFFRGLQTPKHCQHLGGADAVDRSPPQPREGVSLQRPLGLRSSTGRKIPAAFQPLQRDGFKTIINGKLRFELLKLLLFGRVLPCPQLRPRRGALLNRLLEGDLRIDTDAQQLSLPAKLYFILQYLEPLGITSR